jgi:anti-sigma-K factor RskA
MSDERTIGVDDRPLDDLALEALAEAYATAPSAALRARVLAAARADVAEQRAARWRLVGAVAASVALVTGGLLAVSQHQVGLRSTELASLAQSNTELARRLEEQGRTLVGLRVALESQAQVLHVLSGPRTITAALAPKGDVTASGRVVVDPTSGEAALVVADLAPAAEGRTYELWAIRGDRPPEPAGLFAVGTERWTAARVARVERPGEVSAFAVSIEPTGGSASPTGPIVLVGAVTAS